MIAVVALLTLLLPSAALAADEVAKETALQQILGHAIELLAVVIGALVIVLVRKAIKFFEEKTKIDIPAKTEDLIAAWADRAVDYATEKAHQVAKEKGAKMQGPEKLEAALSFGLDLAKQHGLTNLAKEKLTKVIESRLGARR